MKKNMTTFFCLMVAAPALLAHTPSSTMQKLESIKASIISLQKNLSLSLEKKHAVQTDLEATEQQIGETAKALHKTQNRIKNQQRLLNQIQKEHTAEKQILVEQQTLLQQHVRAAYLLGRQQYLKMLLNQENITTVNRNIQYYHYITTARLSLIQQVEQTLEKLAETQKQILEQTQNLQQTQHEEQSENLKLFAAKYQRHQLLTQINENISTKQQALQKLQQDKASLESLLQKIQQTQQHAFIAAPGGSFANTQGKLPWPVPGSTLLQTFNQPIADGRLRSTGILIKGSAGTPVRAVFTGRVVFAHWLRGFGLLTIVQHGPAYLTLYAHAESLYVKPGDSVKAGDTIATIGDSGGLQQSALYFEIRHLDQPLNPLVWLSHSH